MKSPDQISKIGWVFYEDTVAWQESSVAFWRKVLRPLGYGIASEQCSWVQKHFSIPAALKLYSVRLALLDGTLLQGPDLFRYLMRQIWWAYPFYLLASAPVFRDAFDFTCCRFFATRYKEEAVKMKLVEVKRLDSGKRLQKAA